MHLLTFPKITPSKPASQMTYIVSFIEAVRNDSLNNHHYNPKYNLTQALPNNYQAALYKVRIINPHYITKFNKDVCLFFISPIFHLLIINLQLHHSRSILNHYLICSFTGNIFIQVLYFSCCYSLSM